MISRSLILVGYIILNLCTLLEIQSFSNFAGFLRPMSEELCRDKPSIYTVSCGSPLSVFSFVATDQWASTKHHMDDLSRHNSSLIGRKNPAKFENDCISRNGHTCRFKITQPNLMILVSFSSAENALYNDVKNMTLLARRVLKIRLSAFFGTPGGHFIKHFVSDFH